MAPQNPLDDDRIPCVPFVPYRCPQCGRHKPFTSNVRGRLRAHQCQVCGQRYRSWEMSAKDVQGFHGKPPADPSP